MKAPPYVCKHCGSDDIFTEVEARGTSTGGVYKGHDDKPYFEVDRTDYDDFEITDYRCGNCHQSAFKLESLVTPKLAPNQLQQPCGRCDHDVAAHPLDEGIGVTSAAEALGFTRPLRPCEVEGCDCHDFYDTPLSLPNAQQLELATA